MRLSFCYPTPSAIEEGVRRLSTVVQSELEVVQMFGVKDRVSAHRKGINIPAPDTF